MANQTDRRAYYRAAADFYRAAAALQKQRCAASGDELTLMADVEFFVVAVKRLRET